VDVRLKRAAARVALTKTTGKMAVPGKGAVFYVDLVGGLGIICGKSP
jgi:hypothetical protein